MTSDNKQNWFVGIGIANIFWIIGEIIGDWYPLLRTKAIINNEKKIRMVYLTCAVYNIIKVFSVFHFFYQFFNITKSHDYQNDGDSGSQSMTKFGLSWWILITITQISSFFYDLSIIICLKQNLFNQLHDFSLGKNSFVERFKRISEFRIVISMLATMIFLPVILLYIIFVLKYSLDGKHSIPFDDDSMESIRKVVIGVNYSLMYIDQILLKCYVKRNTTNNNDNNNPSYETSSSKIYSKSIPSFSDYPEPSLKISPENKKYYELTHKYHTLHEPQDNIINIENYYAQSKSNYSKGISADYTQKQDNTPKIKDTGYQVDIKSLMTNIQPFDRYYNM
ncbi:hypothetical protein BCR36DRAFT_584749 [Piromyces finnis]|uniref:Uncharacterized protein n=1 Tax=Piromyces finnis TaxID=1754191 RepID=A0A1Y1V6F8_9FUNG|nr:hypothetical protein BCR36DRAFT_584749 [Piromyces finnis]|eukprot:ORX47649.1 hypothetical protein BCR36DRAFT_584749 [Piromyces finnis]